MTAKPTQVYACEVVRAPGRQERLATFAAARIRRQIAPGRDFTRSGLGAICQPEAGQRHAGEAKGELLQCPAARDRLGNVSGEFIELIFHNLLPST